MDSRDIDRIKHTTNTEVIRRLLVKYFIDKGFVESFDRQVYPSIIQDLPYVIPVLMNKVEITPFAEEVDPGVGKARLGWNLFVLGNQRMYLGETMHNDLRDLARQIHTGLIIPNNGSYTARKQTTPRRIVTFITRVLGDHDAGYVDLSPNSTPPGMPGQVYGSRQTLSGMPQQFFSRSGYGV